MFSPQRRRGRKENKNSRSGVRDFHQRILAASVVSNPSFLARRGIAWYPQPHVSEYFNGSPKVYNNQGEKEESPDFSKSVASLGSPAQRFREQNHLQEIKDGARVQGILKSCANEARRSKNAVLYRSITKKQRVLGCPLPGEWSCRTGEYERKRD